MSFHWKIIQHESPLMSDFISKSNRNFPKLPPLAQEHMIHIGGFAGNDLMGGISLKESDNIAEDAELNKHWGILRGVQGTRMLRLWVEGQNRRSVVCEIFRGVMQSSKKSTFLYGVLSLPLGLVHKQAELFKHHLGMLIPKTPVDLCHWNPDENPTSEGRKLLRTYLGVGADFLGPPSGNPEDRSVRIAMGMPKEQVKLILPGESL